MSRYRFIAAEQAPYPIMVLCRVLGVARAGSSAWKRRGVSARAQADAVLTAEIQQVHADLAARGIAVSRQRVARLMKSSHLVGCGRRRRTVCTTVADPTATPALNVIARNFYPAAPNRLWVGDITYVPTDEGWLYVATLLDAYSRRVVGWSMADHLRTDLALDALVLALRRRQIASDQLVHHTDRGGPSTAAPYQSVLVAAQITCAMSRTGNGYDHAMAESFFATFKSERIDRGRWATRRAARQAIFEWLEVVYNRQRRHSALGYLSPVAFEARYDQTAAA